MKRMRVPGIADARHQACGADLAGRGRLGSRIALARESSVAASHGRRRSNTSPSTSQAPRTARGPDASGKWCTRLLTCRLHPPMGKGSGGRSAAAGRISQAPGSGRRQRGRSRFACAPRARGNRREMSVSVRFTACPITAARITLTHHELRFVDRHIGPDAHAVATLLSTIGVDIARRAGREGRARGDLRPGDRRRCRARAGGVCPRPPPRTRRWPSCARWPTRTPSRCR